MRDEEKPKEQLIRELNEVRRCFDELSVSEARLRKAEDGGQGMLRLNSPFLEKFFI